MKIDVNDYQDVNSEGTLRRGWYEAQITEAQEKKPEGKSARLQVTFTVTEDIGNKNDKDVTEKKITDFFQLEGFEHHKDGGEYAKSRLKALINAADLSDLDTIEDPAEFVGSSVWLLINRGTDMDGLPTDNIRAIKKPGSVNIPGASSSDYA
jgi:hypothetical protein